MYTFAEKVVLGTVLLIGLIGLSIGIKLKLRAAKEQKETKLVDDHLSKTNAA